MCETITMPIYLTGLFSRIFNGSKEKQLCEEMRLTLLSSSITRILLPSEDSTLAPIATSNSRSVIGSIQM